MVLFRGMVYMIENPPVIEELRLPYPGMYIDWPYSALLSWRIEWYFMFQPMDIGPAILTLIPNTISR